MKKLSVVVLLLSLLFLSGCISYREDLELNLDGSGKAAYLAGCVTFIEGGDFKYKLEVVDGFTVISDHVYEEGGCDYNEIIGEFESFDVIAEMARRGNGFSGIITLTENDDGSCLFARDLTGLPARIEENLGVDPSSPEFQSELAEMVEEYPELGLAYSVRFPGTIIDANANPEDIDQDANTVRWSFSLTEAVNDPPLMQATFMPQR
ncbi:MAG: hypothetical protein GX980_00100 [Firmicutes bacterium]|jgi:hypothetical protein|nr:hypothetical protein [Bacillota bacterium]